MVLRFTRWTAECGCVFELEADPDSPNAEEREARFALANYICPKHDHMKSTKHKAKHEDKSKHIMDVLETAKQSNIDHSLQHIARFQPGSYRHRRALNTHNSILNFNEDIHNEWSELTSNTHAYDEHIYDAVVKENQQQQEQQNG
jgi:hypothetical protein